MIEFPEVFYAGRVDPLTEEPSEAPAYLDAVIGNPPFLGRNAISDTYGDCVSGLAGSSTMGLMATAISARTSFVEWTSLLVSTEPSV